MSRTTTATTLVLLAALIAVAAGCGSSAKTASSSTTAAPTGGTGGPAAPCPTPTALAAPAGVTQDLSKKPVVTISETTPPTSLVVQDLVVGKGRAATCGDAVTVQYVGVAFSTKKQFDASWDHGQPFPFTLGTGNVIPGWDQGVVGMRVGGRRELTIPPALGYGAQGTGDGTIGPNETLVFVVDLVKIGG
jgi:peptidylprolyl isomerase